MKAAFMCALCHTADHPRSKKKRDLCELCYDGLAPRNLAWCAKGHRVKASDMARGRLAWCRACKNAAARASYKRGTSSERAKAWRQANADARRAYEQTEQRRAARRARDRANAKRLNEKKRVYRQGRRERDCEIMRRWRAAHAEQCRAAYRSYYLRKKLRILQAWRRAA